jgi:hypothetical protein
VYKIYNTIDELKQLTKEFRNILYCSYFLPVFHQLEKLKRIETSLEKKSVLEEKSLEKELKNTELSLSMQGDQGVPGLPGIRGPSGTDGRPVRNNYNTVYF